MPPRGVKKGTKRARQYERIKGSIEKQGVSESKAEEVAARTVKGARPVERIAAAVPQLDARHLLRSSGRPAGR